MDSVSFILQFYNHIDVLLLIFLRVTGFLIILPVLAGGNIPAVVRLALSLAISYIIFASNKVTDVTYVNNIAGYTMLMLQEFIVGFTLAFVVYVIFSIMYLVGFLIDTQIGFSMVNVYDPVTQIQSPIAGNLLFMMMCLIMIQSGGLEIFLQGIFYSYDILPVGKAMIVSNGAVASEILRVTASYIVLGAQFAMPVVGAILVIDIALGLLVKAVPQMNIFVVGMPIKMLAGLAIFYFVMPVFLEIYSILFDESMKSMVAVLKGMAQ